MVIPKKIQLNYNSLDNYHKWETVKEIKLYRILMFQYLVDLDLY